MVLFLTEIVQNKLIFNKTIHCMDGHLWTNILLCRAKLFYKRFTFHKYGCIEDMFLQTCILTRMPVCVTVPLPALVSHVQ